MLKKVIYYKSTQEGSDDPFKFETDLKYQVMWFLSKYHLIRNKVEFYYGPYTGNEFLWKPDNQLRILREKNENISMKFLEKMNIDINLIGRDPESMNKVQASQDEKAEFINDLL